MATVSEKLKEVMADLGKQPYMRRDFASKCAMLAATDGGFRTGVVADFFGTTKQTASDIKRALAGSGKYPNIIAEFDHLGPEAFREKYMTVEMVDGLHRVATNQKAAFAESRRALRSYYDRGQYVGFYIISAWRLVRILKQESSIAYAYKIIDAYQSVA